MVFESLGCTVATYAHAANGVNVRVYGAALGEWFSKWLGNESYEKAIPSELMDLPFDDLRHIIQGGVGWAGTRT